MTARYGLSVLVAAALVPDTVLLLPGAAGRGPDDPALVRLREAAAAAVRAALRPGVRVVVVAPGRADRSVTGPVTAGAAAAGVPDHLLADPVPRLHLTPPPGVRVADGGPTGTGVVVGLRLALDAGVPAGDLHAVEVAPGPADALRATGAALCGAGPVVLVVVGSGSARHGEDAPQAGDARAEPWEAGVLAALRTSGAAARDALSGLDGSLAAALAVTGWAPWQVLVGALGDAAGTPHVVHAEVWRGAAHAAVAWPVAP